MVDSSPQASSAPPPQVPPTSQPRPPDGIDVVRARWLMRWVGVAGACSIALALLYGVGSLPATASPVTFASAALLLLGGAAVWAALHRFGRRGRYRVRAARLVSLAIALAALICWLYLAPQSARLPGVVADAGVVAPWMGVAVWLLPFVHWLPGAVVCSAAVALAAWLLPVPWQALAPAPLPSGVLLVAAAAALLAGAALSRRVARLVDAEMLASHHAAALRRDLEASEQRTAFEAEQRRAMEKELTRARDAAEEATRAKTEFLATMSHEIRTPLNGILPILELLQDTGLNTEQQEYLDTAYKSSRHLLRLINDILDYAKVEAGKLELENIEVNVQELVESVADLMGRAAEGKGLGLSVHVHDGVPEAVRGDPIRLRQVLTNLVSNAVKFTNQGGIRLEVKRQRMDHKNVDLLFAVTDTGVGMTQDAARRLFQSFTQADASTTRKHGGTGLGLVICKRLVELMGGRIGVRTSINKGSTFWFLLPMRRSLHDVPSVRRDLHGVRALTLVKDSVEREQLTKLLQGLGILEVRADSAMAALGKLKNSAVLGDSWKFDVVIVDIRGHEQGVASLVREVQTERLLGALPILIVAPPGGDVEAFKRYRGASVLKAPLQREKLKFELDRLLDVGESAWRTAPGIDAGEKAAWAPALMASEVAFGETLPEARVLLVEDNPINLAVARRLLERLGMIVSVAEDGHECLLRIEREGPFALVLMDVQMPVMDGYEATRKIREMERSGTIDPVPVVAMTANAMQGDRERCLEAGMDDYLPKPIDLGTLRVTLGRWLGARRSGESPAPAATPGRQAREEAVTPVQQAEQEVVGAPVPAQSAPAETAGALDRGVLDDLKDIMEDEFARLIVQFLEQVPTQLAELETAARVGDVEAMVRPAHSLKSSSANMGAMRVSHLAREIEFNARESRRTAAVAALPALREAFDKAAGELQAYIAQNT